MAHLNDKCLSDFAAGRLTGGMLSEATAHLQSCEFCREALALIKAESGARSETIPADFLMRAEEALLARRQAVIVPLRKLQPGPGVAGILAADGEADDRSAYRCLATHICESPELVLRIMQDVAAKNEFVQLVADSNDLLAGVLVTSEANAVHLLTDENGHADLADVDVSDIEQWEWEVRTPDAVLQLELLSDRFAQPEDAQEAVLTSDRDDAVQVRLQRSGTDRRILLEILRIGGTPDFSPVSLFVKAGGKNMRLVTGPHDAHTVELGPQDAVLEIRIFQ